jgi:predicted RND superfamily exporter protein
MTVLESVVRFATRHPIITLLIVLGLTLLALIPASGFQIDTSMEGFLHADDPDIQALDDIGNRFGEQQLVTVVVDCSESSPSYAEAYIGDIAQARN